MRAPTSGESNASFPYWSGEIYLELHRATLTTQNAVKKLHRRAERALITAETVASLAHLIGAAQPQSLEPIWRSVLKNEFHDILPGSGIREIYEDAAAELTESIAAAKAEQDHALQSIAELCPRGAINQALVIVNPSLHERSISLILGDQQISSDETVPPLGVRVIDPAKLKAAEGLTATRRRLENKHLIVEIGDDGAVSRLVHKATGREALAGRGNQIWAYPRDVPRSWDAWDIDEDYEQRGEEVFASAPPELLASDAHSAAIRVERRYPQHAHHAGLSARRERAPVGHRDQHRLP